MKAMNKSYYGKNFAGAIHGFLRAQDDPRQPRTGETEEVVKDEEQANLAALLDGVERERNSLGR